MLGYRTPVKRRMSEKREEEEIKTNVRRRTGEFEALNKMPKSPQQPSTSSRLKKEEKTGTEKALQFKKRIMTSLSITRNTKTEIKHEIQTCAHGLYELVKEAEEKIRVFASKHLSTIPPETNKEERKIEENRIDTNNQTNNKLLNITELLNENTRILKEIKQNQVIQKENYPKTSNRESNITVEKILEENNKIVTENSKKLDNIKENVKEFKEEMNKRSYASVVAEPRGETPTSPHRTALHSIVVKSEDVMHTSQDVLDIVRKTLKAKEKGIAVESVRKAKDQKVIIGCRTEEARREIKEKLMKTGNGIAVEDVVNKKPLIVLKNVMGDNTDADIKSALQSQNCHIFGDISEHESTVEILFRKKTRNPQVNHVVARVASMLWKRMTEQGYLYIDLQKVRVEDHSPLIQCSMCLGYGHSRKLCSEKLPKCSHCGGSHVRAKCGEWLANTTPSCPNCSHAKMENKAHNAFSNVCPIRQKWDSLARSTIDYR